MVRVSTAAAGWFAGVALAIVMVGCSEDPQKPPAVVDPCVANACDPENVVTQLSEAYRTRDHARYSKLFHDDFLFILQPPFLPEPSYPEDWGKTEELRIHKRMFEPQNIGPTEEPLHPDLWLVAVDITLTGNGPWVERPEYYVSTVNPDGLDALRWKAWGTEYTASVLFQTAGETDYQITGKAWFVVVEDLQKTPGEVGAFLLYQWQDLGNLKPGFRDEGAAAERRGAALATDESKSWSLIKLLYK
jgi:hypothetical protein